MIQAAVINPIVERQLARFEAAVDRVPSTNFTEFLVAENHDDYVPVAVELMRVDLELAWQRGQRKQLSDYRALLPQLLDNADVRSDLAFEEFRTRLDHGECVDAGEYETNYQVDTSRWIWTPINGRADARMELDECADQTPSSAVPLPEPGDDWGDFHIIDELGRGALARTYLAQQRSLTDRLVALKISSTFTAESDKLARLQHTNVVPIYSIHRDHRWSVTCMPFLGRTTLADVASHPELLAEVARRQGPSTREQSVLRLVMAVAEGLAHAHARGILHRDIKPANILLSDDGEPMLLDFNLAIDFEDPQSTSVVGGTVPYMAPEQLRSLSGNGLVDERSDVYSLGVVLYQLLTGRLPWHVSQAQVETDLADILTERDQDWVPDLTTRSPAVLEILGKCLAPNCEQRYQTAGELATDIRAHLADEPLKFGRNVSIRERVSKWSRRHPRLCSLTTAAVLLTVAAAAMAVLWNAREQQVAGIRATEQLQTLNQQLASLRPEFSTAALHPESRNRLRASSDQLAHAAFFGREGNVSVEASLSSEQLQTWRTRKAELAYMRAHIELLAAAQEPDDEKRAQLASQALRWNQLSAETDDSIVAVSLQRLAIERLTGDQRDADQLPTVNLAVPADSATDCVLRGLSWLYEHHQPEAAIQQLRRATRLAPTEPSAWLLLIEAYLAEEELSTAEAMAEVAIALLPDSALPLFQRGLARLRSGQFPAAADDFQAVLELDPDNHRARMNLALALKSAGNLEEAGQQLTLAIDRGFEDPRAFLLRSRVRTGLGNALGARQDLQQGLSLPAVDAEGWLAQGLARLAADPSGALVDFRQSLRINPRLAPAWHNLAHVQSERLGDSEAAINSLGNALHLNPADTMALAGRGVLFARQGSQEQALHDARRLTSLSLDATTEYQLGCIYALLLDKSPDVEPMAIEALASSLRRDTSLAELASVDPDLAKLRETTAFRTMMAAMKQLQESVRPEPK